MSFIFVADNRFDKLLLLYNKQYVPRVYIKMMNDRRPLSDIIECIQSSSSTASAYGLKYFAIAYSRLDVLSYLMPDPGFERPDTEVYHKDLRGSSLYDCALDPNILEFLIRHLPAEDPIDDLIDNLICRASVYKRTDILERLFSIVKNQSLFLYKLLLAHVSHTSSSEQVFAHPNVFDAQFVILYFNRYLEIVGTITFEDLCPVVEAVLTNHPQCLELIQYLARGPVLRSEHFSFKFLSHILATRDGPKSNSDSTDAFIYFFTIAPMH